MGSPTCQETDFCLASLSPLEYCLMFPNVYFKSNHHIHNPGSQREKVEENCGSLRSLFKEEVTHSTSKGLKSAVRKGQGL